MADAAKADGVSLRSVSAYRSYQTQQGLYNHYVSIDGKANAERYSARPGYSEHQTGLALDINTASISAHFENTAEYAWLQANCAKFGFMLRYPQEKESITGYRYEPWHYRYVGQAIAQTCMDQGLTYEEYLAAQTQPGENQAPALFWAGTGPGPGGQGDPAVRRDLCGCRRSGRRPGLDGGDGGGRGAPPV